ncbi:MAG: hypothetical protein QM725_07590 [Lacibacter sp.]
MRHIYLTIVFFLFYSPLLVAQDKRTDSLLARMITNLQHLYDLNPEEKCYMHTDKSFYQSGETIWFKLYLSNNQSVQPLSKVIYTDLSDRTGNLLSKAMWKAENDGAAGSIFLPDTLQSGIYRLRSYTLWMLNEPATIGEQYIFVLSKKDQAKTFTATSSKLKVEYFPEGGRLIPDVNSKVAFRITDEQNLPAANCTVQLIDEHHQPVTGSVTFENNIGVAEFTPAERTRYQLKVTTAEKKELFFPLPFALKNSVALTASNFSAAKIFVKANADAEFINRNKIVYVLAQQSGKTVLANRFDLEEGSNAIFINKKELEPGLLQIILLDKDLQLLSDRWIYVDKSSANNLSLSADHLSFGAKQKNQFTLSFTGIDTPALSISVVPTDLPGYDFISHPDSKMYHIYHSNNQGQFSFCNTIKQVSQEKYSSFLDGLLLTIQPARFSFQQITSGKQPALNYLFETGISLKGHINKESITNDSSKVDVITKGADSSTVYSTMKVGKSGLFSVTDLHFRKSASVYIQAITKEKKTQKIGFALDPQFIDTLSGKVLKKIFDPQLTSEISAKNNPFIEHYSISGIGKQLAEIKVSGKSKVDMRIDSINNAVTSPAFRNSEYTRAPDQNFSYISFAQLFQQEFFGLKFNQGYDRITNAESNNSIGYSGADYISFYLDEQAIDAGELGFINPNDVILIKVNRTQNFELGQFGPGPSVLIYTKSKGYRGNLGFDKKYITGYSIPVRFSNPAYTNAEILKQEDRRTTLFWQPDIKFVNGKYVFEFYNNDYAKKFKVVVQGVDKNGNAYTLEKIIE